jgi:hypothetical protein
LYEATGKCPAVLADILPAMMDDGFAEAVAFLNAQAAVGSLMMNIRLK